MCRSQIIGDSFWSFLNWNTRELNLKKDAVQHSLMVINMFLLESIFIYIEICILCIGDEIEYKANDLWQVQCKNVTTQNSVILEVLYLKIQTGFTGSIIWNQYCILHFEQFQRHVFLWKHLI